MLKNKNSAKAFIPIVVVITVCFLSQAQAQKPTPTPAQPANVKVINTTSEPVPVVGTVNGAVSVENGSTLLRVRDVSESLRQPFYESKLVNPNVQKVSLETVAPGKLLVIEHISGYSSYANTLPLPWMSLTVNGSVINQIAARTWSDNSPGFRLWLYSEPVHVYVAAGQTIGVEVPINAESFIYLTGYYVDVQ
jgi:hypothetical protein